MVTTIMDKCILNLVVHWATYVRDETSHCHTRLPSCSILGEEDILAQFL